MSATTINPNETYIPAEDELKVEGGAKAWRWANGKLVRGQEIEKTGNYLEERKSITGLLERVSHQIGTGKFGPYNWLEVDILTRNGIERVRCNMLDEAGNFKPSTSALNFAWGVTQYKKGDPCRFESALGEPVTLPSGKKGGRPTYVNYYRVVGTTATPIYRPKRNPNEPKKSATELWDEIEPQLKKHDAYKEREIKDENNQLPGQESALELLTNYCLDKGWPTPEKAPTEWLQLVAQALAPKGTKPVMMASLSDYSDAIWNEVLVMCTQIQTIPAILKRDRQATTPSAGLNAAVFGDYDPATDTE